MERIEEFFEADGLILGGDVGQSGDALNPPTARERPDRVDTRLILRQFDHADAQVCVWLEAQTRRIYRVTVEMPQEYEREGVDAQAARTKYVVAEWERRLGRSGKKKKTKTSVTWRWIDDDRIAYVEYIEKNNFAGRYADLRLTLESTVDVDDFAQAHRAPVGEAPPAGLPPAASRYPTTKVAEDLERGRRELLAMPRDEAVDAVLAAVDWDAFLVASGFGDRYLDLLAPATLPLYRAHPETVLSIPVQSLRTICRWGDEPVALARAAIAWLEDADEGALPLLLDAARSVPLRARRIDVPTPMALRALRLCSLDEDEPAALLRWLVEAPAFIGAGTAHIAEQLGLQGRPPWARGRGEVEYLALLWTAWQLDHDLFFEIAAPVLDRPQFHNRAAFAATNFVPWEIDREVRDDTSVTRVRCLERFIMQWSGKVSGSRQGRLFTRLHDSREAAVKDADNRLKKAATKLSREVSTPTVALWDPFPDERTSPTVPVAAWPDWWRGEPLIESS